MGTSKNKKLKHSTHSKLFNNHKNFKTASFICWSILKIESPQLAFSKLNFLGML